jgi:hypothetical protein
MIGDNSVRYQEKMYVICTKVMVASSENFHDILLTDKWTT